MTNHYIDLKNSDCILIMGSNAAENHPIAFKWILRAKDRGAKIIHVDPRYTLENQRCVYQMLKKHYERYTLDTVSSITGVSKDNLLKVYNEYGATGAKDKAGTECYALGWTHHTVGSQNIRAMSIIQLLLGNMGICGGGINALRGEPNVQGSTDHAILYNILPGYLKMPSGAIDTLPKYLDKYTSKSTDPQSANWYQNYPKVANADTKFPYVCTTYSCTEHWCSGFTRWQPWLLEAMPEEYVEISDKLAEKLSLKNGERVKVASVRGEVTCVAMVTKRVTRGWVKKQHPKWLKEMEEDGTLVVYGENKAAGKQRS